MNRRMTLLTLLAFGGGFGLAVGLFFGLRFLVVSVQHGGVW